MLAREQIAEIIGAQGQCVACERAFCLLNDARRVFSFSGDRVVDANAGELERVYSVRLAHCRKHAIKQCGLSELVDALRVAPRSARISPQVFLSEDAAITVFIDQHHRLVGCVVVDRTT